MVGVCAPHSQQLGALHGSCCGSRMLWPLDALRHVPHFPAHRHQLVVASAAAINEVLAVLLFMVVVCCLTMCKAVVFRQDMFSRIAKQPPCKSTGAGAELELNRRQQQHMPGCPSAASC